MNIAIPEYFTAYNMKQTGDGDPEAYLKENAADKGKASECINCKKCEEICPQHIAVTKNLDLVSKAF